MLGNTLVPQAYLFNNIQWTQLGTHHTHVPRSLDSDPDRIGTNPDHCNRDLVANQNPLTRLS